MKQSILEKKTCFLFIILCVFAFLHEQNVYSTSLTINPTFGSTGTLVSMNGTGYTPSIQTSVASGSTRTDGVWNGTLNAEELTGLPSGRIISQMGLDFVNSGTGTFAPIVGSGPNRFDGVWYNLINLQEVKALISGGTISKIVFDVAKTGTGTFTNTTNTNARGDGVWSGPVWVEKYSGMSSGAIINKVGLDIETVSPIRIEIYDDSGTGGTPGNLIGYSSVFSTSTGFQNFTVTIPATIPADGNAYIGFQFENTAGNVYYSLGGTAYGLSNDFTMGAGPNHVSSYTTVGALFWSEIIYNQSGAIRIKIYDDTGTGGTPGNLLAESQSLLIKGLGLQNFTIPATIPADGKIYVGLESNDTSSKFWYTACCGPLYYKNYVYGAGPSTFGNSTNTNSIMYMQLIYNSTGHIRVKIYDDSGTGGTPGNLLAESGSLVVPANGLQNFTFPFEPTVPVDGKIYAAVETGNTNMNFYYTNPANASFYYILHSYGAGPSTFGNATIDTSSLFYTLLTYGVGAIVPKWDGSPLTTNPSDPILSLTGGFTGVTFNVPSAIGGIHTVNVTDTNGKTATAQFTVSTSSVSFRMALNDNSAIIPTGYIVATQNGVSQTVTTNDTGWVNFSNINNGLWNFTFVDNSNNFAVYKMINFNVVGNLIKTINTWEIPFNCVSPYTGYQSDFIIQNNDTTGHHITGIQGPKCVNTNELKYNVTFTANGNSGSLYNSLTRITMGSSIFTANPQSFKINGSSIQTIQTTGVNMLTVPYLVGTGLKNETLDYDILLTKSGATVGGASGGSSTGQLYVTNNSSCFAGVFNPLTNSCQFGLIGVTVTVPPIVVNPTSSNTTTINIQCQGTPYLTINNVNLGSNPLGFQIIGLPTTVDCGQNTSTPSSCPVGTTLQNGECITSATCPLANQLSNGQCVGPVSCPSGSNAVNGQCIIPATCSGGVQPVNGVCQVNGTIIVQAPPTNSSQSCGLTNPIACVTGSSQSEPATLTGVAPNGQSVAVNTVLTSLTNPELNNVSIVMIGLIITAAIGGAVYRYILKKEKSSSRKPRKTNGKKGNIEKFNSNLRKK